MVKRSIVRRMERRTFVIAGSALVSLAAACTDGPGRAPMFADAAEPRDLGFEDARTFADARVPDAGMPDSAVELPDTGRPPDYPFSGIFSILNDANPLYAREVQGRLHLVIGGHPYTYTGTITPSGRVDLVSPVLLRSGCAEARITGDYERPVAAFFLTHVTCNAQGQRVEGQLRGGFTSDFNPFLSGVYQLEIQRVVQPSPCYFGPALPQPALYGVSVAPPNLVGIFTAHDMVAPTWYGGNLDDSDATFGGLERLFVNPTALDPSLRGQFLLGPGIDDPPRLVIDRDIWDLQRGCGYSLHLEGERIAAP